MTAPSISVIICAYTEERWTELVASIRSIQAQVLPAQQIILVIDHNSALFKRAQSEFSNDIQVIENQERRGLSGARNSGIAIAIGDIVAFIDEDATAAQDWLMRLAQGYREPQILGVGGGILPHWVSARPTWFPEEFNWVVGCTYRGMPEVPSPVRNLIGCNMSFRRSLFDKVGGFESGIGRIGTNPLGCEETELCIRARQANPSGQFLFIPDALVFHRVPQSRTYWSYFRARCYAEGISKAQVTSSVGAKDGLATERSYTLSVLPRGVLSGVVEFVSHRKTSGLARAGAIVAGLLVTSAGYINGRIVAFRPLNIGNRESQLAGQ